MNSIDTNRKQQRNFFFLMGSLLIAWGCWKFFGRNHPWAVIPMAAGIALFGMELLVPKAAALCFTGWMRFAAILGHVNTTILITVVYLIVLTPVGIIRRALGKSLFTRITFYRTRKSSFEPLEAPAAASYSSPF